MFSFPVPVSGSRCRNDKMTADTKQTYFVEFVGCTSSGKTTLLRNMRNGGAFSRMGLVMGDDVFLGKAFSKVKSRAIRSILIDGLLLIRCPAIIFRRRKLIRDMAVRSWRREDSLWMRINLVRNFVKRVALHDFFEIKRTGCRIVFDEGPIQAFINIFVHYEQPPDTIEFRRLCRNVPHPSLCVLVTAAERDVVRRSTARRDPAYPGLNSTHWKTLKNHFDIVAECMFEDISEAIEVLECDTSESEDTSEPLDSQALALERGIITKGKLLWNGSQK